MLVGELVRDQVVRAEVPGFLRQTIDKLREFVALLVDLDFLLRSRGVNTLLITGVNTNSCVLATTTAANVRDYAVIVVEDCVDTMDGSQMHAAGLACIRTAFGFVMDTATVMQLDALKPRKSTAHTDRRNART